MKFKFDKENFIGNQKIVLFDEGYAEFMTNRILKCFDKTKIEKIIIPRASKEKPKYKKFVEDINIDKFDKNFEDLVTFSQDEGFKIFKDKFNNDSKNEEILNFALEKLKDFI